MHLEHLGIQSELLSDFFYRYEKGFAWNVCKITDSNSDTSDGYITHSMFNNTSMNV